MMVPGDLPQGTSAAGLGSWEWVRIEVVRWERVSRSGWTFWTPEPRGGGEVGNPQETGVLEIIMGLKGSPL